MTSVLTSRQTRRRGIAFAILIACSLLLMAFSSNPVVHDVQRGFSFALRPLQGFIAGVADGVDSIVGTVGEIDRLRTDNQALADDNLRLSNENQRLQALSRENDQLTAILQLRSGLTHATVATRVIGRESLETRRLVILDKGTDDGIAVGQPVVAGDGLVGRVTSASRRRATVLLLTDPASEVGVRLETGEPGVATGRAGSDLLTLDFVSPDVNVRKGEIVTTAGLQNALFPAGLPVARVVSVQKNPGDLDQKITLRPLVDVGRLEFLDVLRWPDASAVPPAGAPAG